MKLEELYAAEQRKLAKHLSDLSGKVSGKPISLSLSITVSNNTMHFTYWQLTAATVFIIYKAQSQNF